ncbi:MAG: hypothetical protein HY720_11445 [Planctomycetes bacterium]|nr:hypothetical protein [Planctomycetota bacterium]
MMRRAVGLLLLVLLAREIARAQDPAGEAWPRAEDGCAGCHVGSLDPLVARPVRQQHGDVHGRAGVGCAGCHGGEPSERFDPAAAHAEAKGFRFGSGVGEAATVRCGECHPGPFGDYGAGEHAPGGEKEVPDCLSCHYEDHLVRSRVREIVTRERCGDCHRPPVLESFLGSFARVEAALDRALWLERDAHAWRDASRASGLPPDLFDERAEEFVDARTGFRDLSHGVDLALLDEAADRLVGLEAATRPAASGQRPRNSPATAEVFFVYGLAALLLFAAGGTLAAARWFARR